MDNQVILITGGSRGIGQALALSLAASGHRIAVTGRNSDHLNAVRKLLPAGSLALEADVSDESAAEAVVEEVIRRAGHIDVLVNNAGTGGSGGPTWTSSPMDWWRVHETNVKGPLIYMNNVLPGMIARNSGTIINIGSYASLRPTPGNSAYASSKAALARLSDSLAAEVAEYNIDIFCLSPGLVKTDMTRDVPVFKDIPDHEWNKPEDICQLVKVLLNKNCSELSGRFIHVNDDVEQLLKNAERIGDQGLYQLGMANLDGWVK